MAGNLIASVKKIDMHPLAFQGIMVYTCFPQIRDMLVRKFGDEYALLFTKPVENVADGQIDWYSPVQGTAQPLFKLPETERQPICDRLSQMAGEIADYAQELIQSRDPLKVTRGNILKLALRYPNDDALYVIGQQPVFTCWGFDPGTPGVEGKNLARIVAIANKQAVPPKREPQPVNVPPEKYVEAEKRNWAVWLWLLLPLLLLFLLLFGSFGRLPALSGQTLFHLPVFDDIRSKKSEIAVLDAEVASLRVKLEKHAEKCVRQDAPAKAPAIQPTPLPKQELVIPDNAQDAAFLKGRWLCDTGLASSLSGEPVRVALSFQDDGKGEAIIYEPNDRCKGEASARLQNGMLFIEMDDLECARSNKGYNKMSIICENADGRATLCKGSSAGGSTWDATFMKIR